MEEKTFPIYKFWGKWDQEDYEDNATGYSLMYKNEPTEQELEKQLQELKDHVLNKYNKVVFKDFGYKFVENESWCLNWFNHYTYNQFESDSEVERSFTEFVNRKENSNLKNGHQRNDMNMDLDINKYPYFSLMGAEDYYRWKICHCEHCQRLGKVTIDH